MSLPHPLLLWALALGCLAVGLRARRPASAPAGGAAGAQGVPTPLRLAARAPCPAGLARLVARDDDAQRIAQAGLEGRLTPAELRRARAGCGLAAAALALPIALLTAPLLALAAPALAAAGAFAPSRWLVRRAARRRRRLVSELPDLLDLLGICVEAGMALDPALRLAAGRLGGLLGAEIERVLADLSLGTPRAAAYRALVGRVGAPELAQTVAALVQAEELGAPLSGALTGQAMALRAQRRQAARDRAARAAPKIQLVVALMMVPAALLLVLGVLLIELSRQVGAVMGGG